MDKSIPRKGLPNVNQRSGAPMGGWFVQMGNGEVVLEAHRGQRWPLRMVSILQGFWGASDNSEGMSKLPRIREYDANGDVKVEGDRVVIDFFNGDMRRPLVRGGVRGISTEDFLPYTQTSTGANPNRLAARLTPLDEDGKATGYVEMEVCKDDRATVQISVRPANNAPKDGPPLGPRTFITIDPGDGNGAGASLQIGMATGETFIVSDGQIAMITPEGHTFLLDKSNGLQWTQGNGSGGAESYGQANGGIALVGAINAIQMISKSVELGNGASPPLEKYILSNAFLADIAALAADVVAIGALLTAGVAAPFVPAAAVSITTKVPASFAAGLPYLSNVIKGQ